MPKTLSRVLAASLSAALVWLSPGLGAIEAFAQTMSVNTGAVPAVIPGVAPVPALPSGSAPAPIVGVGAASLSNLNLAPGLTPARLVTPAASAEAGGVASGGSAKAGAVATSFRTPSAPSARVETGVASPRAAAPRADAEAARGTAQSEAPAPRASAGRLAQADAASARRAAKDVARISVGVKAELKSAGAVSELGASQASGLGVRLERILTGERVSTSGDAVPAAAAAPLGALRHGSGLGSNQPGLALGKPAGWDSIHRAVQQTGPTGPVAPAPPGGGASRRGDGFGGGRRPPFFARVIASLTAFAPAIYFGFPLLAAGAVIPGGLLVAAGLGLAAMPWVGPSLSKLFLGAPGVSILLLGTVTALTIPGWGMAVGALVAFAGWGFARFSRGNRERPSAVEQMSAIFGALSAMVAAGMVLTAASGLVAVGVTAVGSLFAARLLAELPEWFYEGVGQTINAGVKGTRGIHRVLGSIRTDTVLFDRLVRMTERHVKQYGWFAWIWLGALWGPALLSEAFQWVLSAVAGVALAVAQAPAHFGWGALNEVREKHWLLNRYAITFANWGRETFSFLQGGKTVWFNPVEKKLLGLANHKNRAVSLAGGLLVRLAQYVWLAATLALAIPWQGVMFFHSFLRPSDEYVPERHGTSALRLEKDPLPSEKPDEDSDPVPPGSEPFFPRLIGAAVGLVPVYFFGLPFLTAAAPWFGWLFVAAGAAVAAMPLMPQRTPVWLRALPGAVLGLAGLAAAFTAGAPVIGGLTALAGWGLANFATKEHSTDRYYYVTDPEYVGAFFGGLAAVTAIGAALAGLTGALGLGLQGGALLVSALAIFHLPRWFWSGVRTVGSSLGYSPRRVHKVMSFWEDDTQFNRNLKAWWRHWGDRSGWHWWWLWPTLGVAYLAKLYDFLVAGVAGLAAAVVRSPLAFAWGAAYRIAPKSKTTRFIGGLTKGWIDRSEGAKATFDRWVGRLIPAIDRSADSGRPTIGAVAALTAARLVQLAWLARMLVWSPVILVQALLDGVRAARAGTPADDQPDPLSPDYL